MEVTPFDEFRRLKERQEDEGRSQETVEAHNAACAAWADLLRHVEETAKLLQVLEQDAGRALARSVSSGEIAAREDLRRAAHAYERLSWRMCGQLRALLDHTRKG